MILVVVFETLFLLNFSIDINFLNLPVKNIAMSVSKAVVDLQFWFPLPFLLFAMAIFVSKEKFIFNCLV